MQAISTDTAIAKRLLAGDEQAFRELFDNLFPKLYRFALVRLAGNRDDATDVVQQTFCNAFEHIESYRGEASLYGWMCQICRNAITDLMRRRQREQIVLLEDDTAIEGILETLAGPSTEEPEHQAARTDNARLIQALLDRLPDHYGDVLEWKYVDGLSVKEIAVRLTVGQKAAESLLTRARVAFRDALATIAGARDALSAADITGARK
jgi:RNA polymerase sigma-70 factor, ECF subfamily